MRALILTPEWASLVRDARANGLNIVDGAASLGVSERVFKRWCVALGLNAPARLGAPRRYATLADKNAARRRRYFEATHAVD